MWCKLPELPPNLDVRLVEDQGRPYQPAFYCQYESIRGKRFSEDILTHVYTHLMKTHNLEIDMSHIYVPGAGHGKDTIQPS
jgi:hypothetical protein